MVEISILNAAEDSPDAILLDGSSDTLTNSDPEAQEWADNDQEMKRVKVYELIGSRWVDQGTAFCFGHFSPDGTEALLTARSEKNYQEVILMTTIRPSDVYQRQQETLIVWTEPDGSDYALSFQDPDGCAEVWNFILEVQRHMNDGSDDVTSGSVPRTVAGHLPVPRIGSLTEIEKIIKGLSRTHNVKERLCENIIQEDYIKQLIDVLEMAEDVEDLESLHQLCSLMQTILLMNDHSLYEHVVEDSLFLGVVGMLEYDPEFPSHKANYRDFLNQNSQFRQPIKIQDVSIQRKIHQTYRLLFLKDVVLARALDDSTFTVLNACIIFNQTDIINHVQTDPSFLSEIVTLYVDKKYLHGGAAKPGQSSSEQDGKDSKDTPKEGDEPPNGTIPALKRSVSYGYAPLDNLSEEDISIRREVVFLLQQLCAMGKNVQLQARINLFRALVDRGVLFPVQWALGLSEQDPSSKPMIVAAGEILATLLDHDLNGVRAHVVKQTNVILTAKQSGQKGTPETLLQTACMVMVTSGDLAVQSLVGESLKSWLDLPLDAGPPHGLENGPLGVNKFLARKDEPTTERFLDYFYSDCVSILFKPVLDLAEWKNFQEPILSLTREEANRFVYLCDLLYNFTQQHHFRSNYFILTSKIMSHIPTLFKAREKHLRHAAFRFFRLVLKLPPLQAMVLKHDILKPILDLTIEESRRDNLLSCSCQEYFEQIRRDNMKELIKHCMTHHESEITTLAKSRLGGHRFQLFIRRWEMNNEPLPVESKPEKPTDGRVWPPQSRVIDAEEEDYFNADDDDDYVQPISQQQWSRPGLSPNPLKRKRRLGATPPPNALRPQKSPSPALGQLVDYPDEDEEKPDDAPSNPTSTPSSASATPLFKPLSETETTELSSMQAVPMTEDLAALLEDYDDLQSDEEDWPSMQQASGEPSTRKPLSKTAKTSPPTVLSPSLSPARPKRPRNDDDDEDELMERLSKAKKPDLGVQKDPSAVRGRTKPGDDPPKKFKMKIGKSVTASTTPTETKEADTG